MKMTEDRKLSEALEIGTYVLSGLLRLEDGHGLATLRPMGVGICEFG